MPLKMILDNAKEEERPIVRGLLRHIVAGFSGGFALGAIGYVLILISFRNSSIEIPFLFAITACVQLAALGGLVSTGVYMSRVTERDAPKDKDLHPMRRNTDQMRDHDEDRPLPPSS